MYAFRSVSISSYRELEVSLDHNPVTLRNNPFLSGERYQGAIADRCCEYWPSLPRFLV